MVHQQFKKFLRDSSLEVTPKVLAVQSYVQSISYNLVETYPELNKAETQTIHSSVLRVWRTATNSDFELDATAYNSDEQILELIGRPAPIFQMIF